MRKYPIDFVIPIVIAAAAGALVNYAGGKWIDWKEEQSKEKVYSDTMIGAAATENVPVVTSIAEMFEEDFFTFYCDIPMVHLGRSVSYDGVSYTVYELESGENVLVDDYIYNICYGGYDAGESSEMGSDSSDFNNIMTFEPIISKESTHHSSSHTDNVVYDVMPIGRVVKEPVPREIIEQLEENGYTLTDPSFYVDMRGDFEYFHRKDYEENLDAVVGVAAICAFCIIRYIFIASGMFSPLIPLRFLKKWKRYIIYYNTIYYDENVKQMLDYRKQGKIEDAAKEFSHLTAVDMAEAMEAMDIWDEIYEEGIL